MKEFMQPYLKRNFIAKLVLFMLATLCVTGLFTSRWLQTDLRMWQHDSEAFALGRIYQMQIGEASNAGLMMKDSSAETATEKMFINDLPFENQNTYWHQIGAQGTVLGVFNRIMCLFGISPIQRLSGFYFVVIWSFMIVLFAICYWFWREFGIVGAILAAVATISSSWTQKSMGNLYWVISLYFVPFVLSAFICRRYEYSQKMPKFACFVIAIGVFIRFLCGFEFASVTLICMEVPIMYYWAKHYKNSKKWFNAAFWAGIFSVAAFAVCFIIWVVQMAIGFGSFQEAYEEMMLPIVIRTGLFQSTMPVMEDVFTESLSVPVLELIRIYLQDETVLGGLTMQAILVIYSSVTTITVAMCAVLKNKADLYKNLQFLVLCIFAFIAPISWHVLGRGHSYIHTHINYILWLIPLLPCVFAHMGYCLQTWKNTLCGDNCKALNTKIV